MFRWIFKAIVWLSPLNFLVATIYVLGWDIMLSFETDEKKTLRGIVAGNTEYVNKMLYSYRKEYGDDV